MKTIKVAVCNGIHDIPQAVDGVVFAQTVTKMNPENLYGLARERLVGDYKLASGDLVNLYVTGLTMATRFNSVIAVVRVCKDLQIKIICHHFDRETGIYTAQLM